MTEWQSSTKRFVRRHRKLLIGAILALIVGVILIPLQALYQRSFSDYPQNAPSVVYVKKKGVTVTPIDKWSRWGFLAPKRYYKVFRVDIRGGVDGFPPNTSIQISASSGMIFQLSASEAIKPTFANGDSAVHWVLTTERYYSHWYRV